MTPPPITTTRARSGNTGADIIRILGPGAPYIHSVRRRRARIFGCNNETGRSPAPAMGVPIWRGLRKREGGWFVPTPFGRPCGLAFFPRLHGAPQLHLPREPRPRSLLLAQGGGRRVDLARFPGLDVHLPDAEF